MHDLFFPAPAALSQLIRPFSSPLGLASLPSHIHEVAIAYAVYRLLFTVISPAISSTFPAYRRLPRRSQIDWNVRAVSTLQSTFITLCALYILSTDRRRASMDWRQRVWGYDGASGMVQGFAAGYFLWDLEVSVTQIDVLGVGSLVHAICALLVTSLGFRPFANYYGLNFILYEISTPFLNVHWFFDKCQMTGSRAQLINGLVLITTFGCSRVLWGTYQSLCLYQDLWKAWNYPGTDATQLPAWLAVVFAGGNTVLCALNYYWFGKMISAVAKRFAPKESEVHVSEKEELEDSEVPPPLS